MATATWTTFFGWDWVDNDNDVSNDMYGHGTHIGGTISAGANNNIGIAGVGGNVRILPLRILDNYGNGQTASLINALMYAKNAGVRIANLSLVLKNDQSILAEAIDLLADDMLIICAAGNGHKQVYWPAAYEDTVAVAATTFPDIYSAFSNYGPEVDLAAPGIGIVSTDNQSGYVRRSGTSMASAHVSALAGLLLSLRPDFSNTEILATIQNTADDINADLHPGPDEFVGHGRVNFYAALLDASAGVQIQAPDGNDLYQMAGTPTDYKIFVGVSSALDGSDASTDLTPISGAAVHFQLFSNSGKTVSGRDTSGRFLTGADGVAKLELLLPKQAGTYILQVQVGQEITHFPVMAIDPPAIVRLNSGSRNIQAGTGKTTISIEALTAQNALISDPIPLLLQTSVGSFFNGKQSIRARLSHGRFDTDYFAPSATGDATITLSLIDQTMLLGLTIEPHAPHTLQVSAEQTRFFVDQLDASTNITVATQDRYGNLLSGEIAYQLTASFAETNGDTLGNTVDDTVLTLNQLADTASISTTLPIPTDAPGTMVVDVAMIDGGPSGRVQIVVEPAAGTALLPEPNDDTTPTADALATPDSVVTPTQALPTGAPISPIDFVPPTPDPPPAQPEPDTVGAGGQESRAALLPLIIGPTQQ